jgi:hypothetical protein
VNLSPHCSHSGWQQILGGPFKPLFGLSGVSGSLPATNLHVRKKFILCHLDRSGEICGFPPSRFLSRSVTSQSSCSAPLLCPTTSCRVPHISRSLRDVGYHGSLPEPSLAVIKLEGRRGGIPHLAKNERDTRISCTQRQPVQRVRLSLRKAA